MQPYDMVASLFADTVKWIAFLRQNDSKDINIFCHLKLAHEDISISLASFRWYCGRT